MASVTKVISSWTFLIWQLMTVYPEVGTWHQEHFIYFKSMTIETNLETHHKQPGTWDSASYCPLVTSSPHILFIIRSYKGCNLRINLAVTRFPLSCPSPPLTLRAAGRFPTGHECSERTEGTGWGGVTTEPNRAERREGKVRGWWHDYRTALVPLAYRPLRSLGSRTPSGDDGRGDGGTRGCDKGWSETRSQHDDSLESRQPLALSSRLLSSSVPFLLRSTPLRAAGGRRRTRGTRERRRTTRSGDAAVVLVSLGHFPFSFQPLHPRRAASVTLTSGSFHSAYGVNGMRREPKWTTRDRNAGETSDKGWAGRWPINANKRLNDNWLEW